MKASNRTMKINEDQYGEYASRLRRAVTRSARESGRDTTVEEFEKEMKAVDEACEKEAAKYSQAEKTAMAKKLLAIDTMKTIARCAEERPHDAHILRSLAVEKGMNAIEAACEQAKRAYERHCRVLAEEGLLPDASTVGSSMRDAGKCTANRKQRRHIVAKKEKDKEDLEAVISETKMKRLKRKQDQELHARQY